MPTVSANSPALRQGLIFGLKPQNPHKIWQNERFTVDCRAELFGTVKTLWELKNTQNLHRKIPE